MDGKELRKFGKKELLEILLSQAKRIEELEYELNKTKKKLESKKIIVEESGSLAEAALRLNNIFEVAQETAEMYLLNIKENCKKIENDTKKDSLIKPEKMISETEEVCKKRKEEADEYLKEIELKVKDISKNKKRTETKKKTIDSVKNKNIKVASNKTIKNKSNKKVILDKVKKEI